MAKVREVSRNVYLILQGLIDGFLKNDINPDIDKDAQKGAEQIRANETPDFINSREKKVQDYSKTIPKEGRVVIKAEVDERKARITADEVSKQKGNSQKDRSR